MNKKLVIGLLMTFTAHVGIALADHRSGYSTESYGGQERYRTRSWDNNSCCRIKRCRPKPTCCPRPRTCRPSRFCCPTKSRAHVSVAPQNGMIQQGRVAPVTSTVSQADMPMPATTGTVMTGDQPEEEEMVLSEADIELVA